MRDSRCESMRQYQKREHKLMRFPEFHQVEDDHNESQSRSGLDKRSQIEYKMRGDNGLLGED